MTVIKPRLKYVAAHESITFARNRFAIEEVSYMPYLWVITQEVRDDA